ncbi:glycosyltransferase [Haloferax sp. YSMS24]|uniref:glycosyltransferase n=1 Tax=Haloferax sp. YSMS24 TaxID=3388425 RepID=UPI00398D48B1
MTDDTSQSDDAAPLVSVVTPVYNAPEGIQTTLDCLVDQTLSPDQYEILVVDNNSTDDTASVIKQYESEYENVHYLFEDEYQSSYAARNRAICEARAPLLAFIDADMSVDSDWLEMGIDAMDDDVSYMAFDVDLYSTGENETLAEKYDRLTGFPIEQYVDEMNFGGAGCIFVRRAVFDDVGLFDPRFVSGGDFEFGNRVADAGYEQQFTDTIVGRHEVRATFQSQVKKDIRVGRGICQRQVYYPERFGKAGIPPLPSGIKSADDDADSSAGESSTASGSDTFELKEKMLFTLISAFLVLCRTYGYFNEYLFGDVYPRVPMTCEELD